MDVEQIARDAVDCSYKIHCERGPGLLESVYETLVAKSLEKRGYRVERQRPVTFTFDGITFEDAFRSDILVENAFLIEIKSADRTAGVHVKQTLTYLRLLASQANQQLSDLVTLT